ncbi:MAG TPA: 50S ribosomal protein L3 [Candidatus Yonathbacteria bacterium]|nr:50S ribosomal protein L3 [Candidatus Yonathbacteria bacterium]
MVTDMKFILGRKENMVTFIGNDGLATAATLVAVGPAVITQIKNKDTDGYESVQIGFGTRAPKNISKAVQGHTKDLGSFAAIREFRVDDSSAWKKGDTLDASLFTVGDEVTISGTSKGKGFQGVVKRHGFHGGSRTHGQKHSEREPGSIGSTGQQKISKGRRMAGRMGSDRTTIKGLRVLGVDTTNNKILVSGCVPGIKGALLEIKA